MKGAGFGPLRSRALDPSLREPLRATDVPRAGIRSLRARGLIRIQSLRRIGLFDAYHRVVRIHFAPPHVRITAIATEGPIASPFPVRYVILTLHASSRGS